MKIIVFDLDDTLIDELSYVYSGLNYVSKKISKEFTHKNIKKKIFKIFKKKGRGQVFDIFFKSFVEKKKIFNYVSFYRRHYPEIKFKKEAIELIKYLNKKRFSLYLVTDGNKIAQKQKIKKLNLKKYFKKIYITHEFGDYRMKPNLYCFKKIKNLEKVKWSEIVYIGDNPNKDFVNLNKVGAITVRVLTGPFKNVKSNKEYDAKYKIKSLNKINLKLFN